PCGGIGVFLAAILGQRRGVRQAAPQYLADEMDMEIRDAVPADAPAACEVIRRSITELCVADHHNEPAILERWLTNKTPEIVASWITQPGSSVLVAVEGGVMLAVGSVTDQGEITLNYVSQIGRAS